MIFHEFRYVYDIVQKTIQIGIQQRKQLSHI